MVLRSLPPQAVHTGSSPNPSMAFADHGVMEKRFAHRPVRVRELRPGFELYFYTDPFVGKKIHGAEPLLPYMEIDVKSVIVTSHRVCGETERGWINLATDHNRRGEKRLVYYADPCDAPLRVATTAMPPLEDTGETAPSLENTCAQGVERCQRGQEVMSHLCLRLWQRVVTTKNCTPAWYQLLRSWRQSRSLLWRPACCVTQ